MAGIEVATGELMEKKSVDKSWAKKYGLEGKGIPVKISKETQDTIRELHARGKRAIEAGQYYARHTKHTFGGVE